MKTNGYRLDKGHTFQVNSYEDFNKYVNVPDTYTPPEVKPFETKVKFLEIWINVIATYFNTHY